MRSLRAILAVALCLFGAHCSVDTVAGGTTDSGNSRVTARVYDTGGNAVEGAVVRLRPSNYVTALPSLKKSVVTAADALTDAGGRFEIAGIDKGKYRIEINGNGTALLLSCELDGMTAKDFGADTVRPYATVRGMVEPASAGASKRFVQVAGLERLAAVDSTGHYSIDDLPASAYELRIVSADSSSAPLVIDSIAARPGETTTAPVAGWRFTKSIFLNTTASGADVAEDVVAFPLLVRLDAADFDFSSASDSGRDIRFTKSDGSSLAYEIEQWNPAAGAAIWVLVDTVRGNDSFQHIVMHWGNSSAAHQSGGAAVFDTANGHAGVWHMGDGAGGNRVDATANGYDGRPGNYEGDETVAGIAGLCDNLDTDDHDTLGDIDLDADFTLSMWVNLTEFAPNARYLSKAYTNNASPYLAYGLWNGSASLPYPWGRVSGDAGEFCSAGSPDSALLVGVWTHVAYVHTAQSCRFFYNGLIVGTSTTAIVPQQNDEPAFIAWNEINNLQKFIGKVDEVRISRRARSQAWIRLSYQNQRTEQKVVVMR